MLSNHTIQSTKLLSSAFVKTHKKSMMLLHEYQAQGMLKKFTVPIPKVINLTIYNIHN